jgi:porin
VIEDPGLTNQWFGAGPWLGDRGIRFAAAVTTFGQYPLAGSGDRSFNAGGKLHGLLRVDLNRFGLWEGLSLTVHSEYNFGESSNGFGGTLLPVNLAMQLPGASGSSRYDTYSVFLTQKFNDSVSLLVGKTNLAYVAALHPYAGGSGIAPPTRGDARWRSGGDEKAISRI